MTGDQESLQFPAQDASRPFLRTAQIRNYKSIAKCSVDLASLTVLVGRNAAGKSNFLDGLRFVADALQYSLDHAFKSRGGIDAVRRISTGHPHNFAVNLSLDLPSFLRATYGFEIASRARGKFAVKRERLRVTDLSGEVLGHYETREGKLESASRPEMPVVAPDRLYLVNASGLPPFRSVYDALLSMGFYNLNPESMKELQSPDAGELLHRDGSNISSVVARLASDEAQAFARIKEFLQTIVPDFKDVERVALGPRETLLFRQDMKGAKHPWTFYAASMSDGTLRALGALVAVQQLAEHKTPVSLVGIEEPETALHPAATGALMDALREASRRTQILVTCHSPDLVDQMEFPKEQLLVVVSRGGTTQIAPADAASVQALKDHLYTAGELLRMDQLEPDEDALARQQQLPLFDTDEEEP